MKVLIIGGGIAGLASALAFSKYLSSPPSITILEVRPAPSSIGGAIGLTPNALRVLYHLGVLDVIRTRNLGLDVDRIELFNTYSGAKLGQIAFTGDQGQGIGDPALKELRIMRTDLLTALIEAVKGLSNCEIKYGTVVTEIKELESETISAKLQNGHELTADILLGCDGIHSFVRTHLIEPDRKPTYTGIATVMGFTELEQGQQVPWKDTGLCQSQRGTFMGSYFETSRSKSFVAAIMETEDVKSKEGWRALGAEQDKIRAAILERHSTGVLSSQLRPLIEKSGDWNLYPVYKLGPHGRWSSERTILIGDAAHAMPPQGESAAIALEDAILLARVIAESQKQSRSLSEAFKAFETLRRPSVNKSYDESTFGWETQKDCGWLTFQFRAWLTYVFLWWTANARQQRYKEDISTMELKLDL